MDKGCSKAAMGRWNVQPKVPAGGGRCFWSGVTSPAGLEVGMPRAGGSPRLQKRHRMHSSLATAAAVEHRERNPSARPRFMSCPPAHDYHHRRGVHDHDASARGQAAHARPRVIAAFEGVLGEIEACEPSAAGRRVLAERLAEIFLRGGERAGAGDRSIRDSIVPWVERGHRADGTGFEALPLPVVAARGGLCDGWRARACDGLRSHLRVGECAVCPVGNEAGLRHPAGAEATAIVRRVGPGAGQELVFSGRMFDAEEAVRLGVAQWHGSGEELGRHPSTSFSGRRGQQPRGHPGDETNSRVLHRRGLEANAAIGFAASRRCLSEGDAAARLQDFFAEEVAANPPLARDRPPRSSNGGGVTSPPREGAFAMHTPGCEVTPPPGEMDRGSWHGGGRTKRG